MVPCGLGMTYLVWSGAYTQAFIRLQSFLSAIDTSPSQQSRAQPSAAARPVLASSSAAV